VEKQETEFNPEFVKHMMPKIDWTALVTSCKDLDIALPAEVPANALENEEFLKNLHNVLIDLHIQEAALICNNCSRVYPVVNGVPNMLLNEDEV